MDIRDEGLQRQISRLTEIGIALTREHDLPALLEKILIFTREISNADAGTLYIVEGDNIIFLIAQNDTLRKRGGPDCETAPFKPFPLAISADSIAGYVALTGETLLIDDVYELDPALPYSFKSDYDKRSKYRTKSMLVVPMKNPENEMLGVIQLINSLDKHGETQSFSEGIKYLLHSLASQAAVAIENARLTEYLKQAHFDTIYRLAIAAEYKDHDTASHIYRIGAYSAVIAEKLGLPAEDVEMIRFTSPMHDIGKIGIPDNILTKKGRFDEKERSVMNMHAEIGANILGDSPSDILRTSEEIARTHHEKYDGTGYPNGLAGEDIPLFGRIVALADVFDGLCSRRCYKDPWDLDKTLAMIREESGKHFDPECVDAFFAGIDEILAAQAMYPDQEGDTPEDLTKMRIPHERGRSER